VDPHSTPLPPESLGNGQGRGSFDPLFHVILALAACGLSLFVAYVTFWPNRLVHRVGTPLVMAAESQREVVPVETKALAAKVGSERQVLTEDSLDLSTPPPTLAGDEQRATTLACTVVDEGWNPVPRAEVWVDDGEWRLAGRCDGHGRFELPYDSDAWKARLEAGKTMRVGARDERLGPSLVSTFDALPTGKLQLVLRGLGASLRLEVCTPKGRPVPGALLRFDDPPAEEGRESLAVLIAEGQQALPTPPPSARTDAWGAVTFHGLECGKRVLLAEAAGFRPRRVTLELQPGEPRLERIELAPLAKLRGAILGPVGRPLPSTRVYAFSGEAGEVQSASCDDQGRFELHGLPAGELRLLAEARRGDKVTHDARAQLELAAGDWSEWNPVLRPVQSVGGRLTDHEGQPLAGWRVELRTPGDEMPQTTVTDESGKYQVMAPPPPVAGRLTFFHPAAQAGMPTKRVAMPTRDRVVEIPEVELDEGDEFASRIRGRILQADGYTPAGGPAVLQRVGDDERIVFHPDPDSGYFETPAVPPGIYALRFPRLGRGWALNRRLVVDGERTLNIGTVELPPIGRLSLFPVGSYRREACVELHVELVSPAVDTDFSMPVLKGRIELPIQLEFAPGLYRVSLPAVEGQRTFELTVESGELTTFGVPVAD